MQIQWHDFTKSVLTVFEIITAGTHPNRMPRNVSTYVWLQSIALEAAEHQPDPKLLPSHILDIVDRRLQQPPWD